MSDEPWTKAQHAAWKQLKQAAEEFADASKAYAEASEARDDALREADALGIPRPDLGRALAGHWGEPLSKQRVHTMLQRVAPSTGTDAPKKATAKRALAKKKAPRISVADQIASLQAMPEDDFAALHDQMRQGHKERQGGRWGSIPFTAHEKRIEDEWQRRWEEHARREVALAAERRRAQAPAKKAPAKKAPAKKAPAKKAPAKKFTYVDPTAAFREPKP